MEENERILVVEDSENLNDFMAKNLRSLSFEVEQSFNKKDALKKLSKNIFNLVILDLNLGDEDSDKSGMEILHKIRQQDKFVPVIIVSSIQDGNTKIKGFKEGCDDYITKPFFIEELILRVKRILLRFSMIDFDKKPISENLSSGIFEIDLKNQKALKKGKELKLRKKEFELLKFFVKNPDQVLTFQQIYQNVWDDWISDEKAVEQNIYVNIRALRKQIEDDIKNPQYIVSVSKSGYIFVPNGC